MVVGAAGDCVQQFVFNDRPRPGHRQIRVVEGIAHDSGSDFQISGNASLPIADPKLKNGMVFGDLPFIFWIQRAQPLFQFKSREHACSSAGIQKGLSNVLPFAAEPAPLPL